MTTLTHGLEERREHDHDDAPPSAVVGKKSKLGLVWLTPLLAAAVLVYLLVSHLASSGPTIVVTFKTADGIVVQQTQLKHKSVELGVVEDVSLANDTSGVIVKIRTNHDAKRFLTNHARFWVVRPRLSPVAVSSLQTIVSGAYIDIDPGAAGGKEARTFAGLEEPPGVTSDEPGTAFALEIRRLGSLGVGSPIYTQDVKVGEVLRYDLEDERVALRAFVKAPYDKLVHTDTVFYSASGLSLGMGADGVHVELQSLEALVAGAIAFKTPESTGSAVATDGAPPFHVFPSKALAESTLFKVRTPCAAYFDGSVAGLGPGSPVTLLGVPVGSVTRSDLEYDANRARYVARVAFDLEPERIRDEAQRTELSVDGVRAMVGTGARAVLESQNLLTGEKALALRVVPKAASMAARMEGPVVVVPSEAGGIDGALSAIGDVADKLDKIPFEQIGDNLNETLKTLRDTVGRPDLQRAISSLVETIEAARHLVREVDAGMAPAVARLPAIAGQLELAVEHANALLGSEGYGASSDVQQSLARTLKELERTTRTVRVLADHLDHHPESLLRGRTEQP